MQRRRSDNMSIKLSDFLDIDDINFEENSIFQELVKISIVEEKNTEKSHLEVEVDKD